MAHMLGGITGNTGLLISFVNLQQIAACENIICNHATSDTAKDVWFGKHLSGGISITLGGRDVMDKKGKVRGTDAAYRLTPHM